MKLDCDERQPDGRVDN